MKKEIETEVIIQQRIEKINEAVKVLNKLGREGKDKFLKDKQSQYAAMFGMVMGIEAICDIGNHILAKYFDQSAETYKDVILGLGECEVIPKAFAQKAAGMTDFRNLLIHVYLKIDPKKVYEKLQKAPKQFMEFCQYFLKFLSGG
jgi:uncharacterized protein YutE (UPF0331/DUF86 family)